ncbi:MAG: hypothetical protein HOP11_13215 [Saprospiraceae bacterium]|nr:hypothetical protein [Saprospiraceae bacterium]
MYRLIIMAGLSLLFFFQCEKSKPAITKNVDSFSRYINAYPTGMMKSRDVLKIHFNKKAIDSTQIGQEIGAGVISFTPQLKGTAKWINEFTLGYEVDKSSIERTISYVASLQLNRIFTEIPDSLRTFSFEFGFVPITLSMDWDFLHADKQYEGNLMLEAVVTSSDHIPVEKLQKIIVASTSDNKSLPIQVSKIENSDLEYHIEIHNIQREKSESTLKLDWLTDPESAKSRIEESITIPAADQLMVTGIKEDRNDPRCLMVFFTDDLDKKQDLRGLLRVNMDSVQSTIVQEEDIVHVSFNTDEFRSGELQVSEKIKSNSGKNLYQKYVHKFNFKEELPKVRILSSGTILPYSNKVVLPFEAINLNKIDVEIFKIFSNNVLYNMHLNEYDSDYSMTKLGKVVHQQTINLNELHSGNNKSKWISYGLDLTKLITPEPGAIYEARIVFRPQYSSYKCKTEKLTANPSENDFLSSGTNKFSSWWPGYSYYNEEYEGESDYNSNRNNRCYDSNDPCCISYYGGENFARRTFLASNLALMVKSSADRNETYVLAYDVLTASPKSNTEVKLFDYQLQQIAIGKTDGTGMVKFSSEERPAFVMAQNDNHYAYLQIADEKSLTTSEFDVAGSVSQNGIKSYVFLERGVWRPGDTIHCNLILNQESSDIPQTFPVQVELRNPNNQLAYQQSLSQNVMGMYYVQIPTHPNSLTGYYNVRFNYGNSTVQKSVQIETVKPNRFKIDWKFDDADLSKLKGYLSAKFLHGAPASDKRITIEANVSQIIPTFKNFKSFSFNDPEKKSNSNTLQILDGKTKGDGSLVVDLDKVSETDCNGKLNCILISKIMDDGGDISTDYTYKQFDMSTEYLGIQMPETDYASYYSGTNISGIKVACVDKDGNPISGRKLTVELYNAEWDWWYEIRNRSSYYSENSKILLREEKNCITDAKGIAQVGFALEKYSSYYIKVRSEKSNHTCGNLFYTGWRDEDQQNKDFVQVLNLSTDKEKYKIGETCKIELPGASGGTFIVNIIRNNKIIKTEVVKPALPKTQYQFAVNADMFPNAYVDVTMIQGLSKNNDLPLRLYGVVPVMVENDALRLKPVVNMKEIIRPDEDFNIEISEANSSDMTYQLMIVDDGLLSLTRFVTPDPYASMFAKEALTLMSWDNYDQFIGNDLSSIARIFSIGGDQKLSEQDIAKMQRFKPVVLVSGPRQLKKGSKNTHTLRINNYIGSVRVMVVANNYDAFGSVDKNVVVRNELATQITFPRVTSVADKISVPVTVFKYEDNISNAEVSIKASGPVEVIGKNTQSVSFGSAKEKTVWFELKPKGTLGSAKIECQASSGKFANKSFVDFYIDNPNPITTQSTSIILDAGNSKEIIVSEYGMAGKQNVVLEVSRIPKLKTEKYLKDLIHYPHGCIEQTTSAVFPQLYIHDLIDLNSDELQSRANHITAAMKKFSSFQLSEGSMSYWPGYRGADDYASSYVCHFLGEAKNIGFQVNTEVMNKLVKYLSSTSNSYALTRFALNNRYTSNYIQAYRLFALANVQQPEWGAMNRLRMHKEDMSMSRWLLAGAYALSGKKDIAKDIVKDINRSVEPYSESWYSYGSDIRDEALIALVLNEIGQREEAVGIINGVVNKLNNERYPTTQELSMVLSAIGKIYARSNVKSEGLRVSYKWNEKEEAISSDYSTIKKTLNSQSSNTLKISNNSSLPLTINLIQSGKLLVNTKVNKSNGLAMSIVYSRSDGKPYDQAALKQGDQIKARIKITNQSNKQLRNLALSAIFPSGFEIENRRIGGLSTFQSGIEYQDFRDDRILYYFSLDRGKFIDITISLTAAYAGDFAAPLFNCEAMYEPEINAQYSEGSIKIKS